MKRAVRNYQMKIKMPVILIIRTTPASFNFKKSAIDPDIDIKSPIPAIIPFVLDFMSVSYTAN